MCACAVYFKKSHDKSFFTVNLQLVKWQSTYLTRVLSSVGSGPPQFYIGLGPRTYGPVHSVTLFVQHIMANLTGTVTNLTETQCQKPDDISTENKDVSVRTACQTM